MTWIGKMTRAARGVRLQQVVRWDAARRAGLLEGRGEGFGQTNGGLEVVEKRKQTKLNWRERQAFTRRRGVFMGMQ